MSGQGQERPSAEGVVSGFVTAASVRLLDEAISQASVAALASDLLTFWPPTKPPFVLSLFEDRDALDDALGRLSGLAAAGATTIVGSPSEPDGLPAGVYGVDLRECEELVGARAFAVVEGTFAAALVAVGAEGHGDEPSGRPAVYHARWTFRPNRVGDAASQLLRPLRPLLPGPLVAAAEEAVERARSRAESPIEGHMLGVIEALGGALVAAPVLSSYGEQPPARPPRPRVVRQ